MIEELLVVLAEAGLNPEPRELRDALWLAQHLAGPAADARPGGAYIHQPEPAMRSSAADPEVPPETSGMPGRRAARLYAAGSRHGSTLVRATEVSGPAVPGLPHQLEIARALRPFKRRVPSRTALVLDEAATAAQVADEGSWVPVMRPAQARWLDLTLIIDASPSMVLWQHTIAELRRLTERLGAFRVVRTFSADCSADELTPVTFRPGTPAGTAVGLSHRALSLIGADRRQAILVVTDAVGEAWKDGRMGPLLRLWGAAAPVGVAMVLPQRMWAGTGLSVVPAQLYSQFPGSANRALSLRPPGISRGTTPVPVMELTPRWIASWATLVAGARGWRNMAVLAPGNPPARSASMPLSLSPAEAVRAFRLAVSPAAFQLACYLSAAWLSLPVMRLVQQFMLPGSDPAHLAEVFLGGLLRAYPDNMTADPDTIQYDFVPGVRDELNRYLLRDEMLTVVDRTSQFIATRYGQSVDVAALLADPQGAPLPALTGGRKPPPPPYITAAVLAKLGGRYRVLAEPRHSRGAKIRRRGFLAG